MSAEKEGNSFGSIYSSTPFGNSNNKINWGSIYPETILKDKQDEHKQSKKI